MEFGKKKNQWRKLWNDYPTNWLYHSHCAIIRNEDQDWCSPSPNTVYRCVFVCVAKQLATPDAHFNQTIRQQAQLRLRLSYWFTTIALSHIAPPQIHREQVLVREYTEQSVLTDCCAPMLKLPTQPGSAREPLPLKKDFKDILNNTNFNITKLRRGDWEKNSIHARRNIPCIVNEAGINQDESGLRLTE